jgi:hypothetical protein
MDEHKPFFPIAVPSSSGVGGVSPRVSILEDETVNPEPFELAVLPRSIPAAAETEAFKSGLQEMARSFDRACHEMSMQAQSINLALAETLRTNFEVTLAHWQDLATAKAPSEVYALQLAYFGRQMGLLWNQTQELQSAFRKMLRHSL